MEGNRPRSKQADSWLIRAKAHKDVDSMVIVYTIYLLPISRRLYDGAACRIIAFRMNWRFSLLLGGLHMMIFFDALILHKQCTIEFV